MDSKYADRTFQCGLHRCANAVYLNTCSRSSHHNAAGLRANSLKPNAPAACKYKRVGRRAQAMQGCNSERVSDSNRSRCRSGRAVIVIVLHSTRRPSRRRNPANLVCMQRDQDHCILIASARESKGVQKSTSQTCEVQLLAGLDTYKQHCLSCSSVLSHCGAERRRVGCRPGRRSGVHILLHFVLPNALHCSGNSKKKLHAQSAGGEVPNESKGEGNRVQPPKSGGEFQTRSARDVGI